MLNYWKTPRPGTPITPLLRTAVFAVSVLLLAVFLEPPTAKSSLAFVLWMASILVLGLVSGLPVLWRCIAGLVLALPLDVAGDVAKGELAGLGAASIAGQAFSNVVTAAVLPWLDPRARLWRWTSAAAQSMRRVRAGVLTLAWGAWTTFAALGFVALGTLPGIVLRDPSMSTVERIGFVVLMVLVAAAVAAAVFAYRSRRRVTRPILMQALWITLGIAVYTTVYYGVVVLLKSGGILHPDGFAAPVITESVENLARSKLGFVLEEVLAKTAFFSVLLFPIVVGILVLDARAALAGKRSITAIIAQVVCLGFIGMGAGSLVAVTIGALVFQTGGHGQGNLIGSLIGGVVGLAVAVSRIRKRRVPMATAEWPDKPRDVAPLPEIVAKSVADAKAQA